MEKLKAMLSSKKVVPRKRAERPPSEALDRTRQSGRADLADPPRKRTKQTAQRPVAGRTSQREVPEHTADVHSQTSPHHAVAEERDTTRTSGSTLPPTALYSDIVNAALKGSVIDDIRQPRPDNIVDILADLHGSMCQNMAAGSAIMVDLASQWKVDPELLRNTLEKRKVSCVTLEESRLRGEISRLHQDLIGVRAEVSERDIAIEGLKDERNRVINEAALDRARYESRIAGLISKLEFADQQLQKERAEREGCASELRKKNEEIEEMTEVMGQQIDRLKLMGLRQGMTDVMKKIKAKYPDADLKYFADTENIPDEEINPTKKSICRKTDV